MKAHWPGNSSRNAVSSLARGKAAKSDANRAEKSRGQNPSAPLTKPKQPLARATPHNPDTLKTLTHAPPRRTPPRLLRLSGARFRSANAPRRRPETCKARVSCFARTSSRAKRQRRAVDEDPNSNCSDLPGDAAGRRSAHCLVACPGAGNCHGRRRGIRRGRLVRLVVLLSFNLLILLLAVNVLLLALLLLAATSLALHLPAFAAGAYAPSYQS